MGRSALCRRRLTEGCSASPKMGMSLPISIRMSSKFHRRFLANSWAVDFGSGRRDSTEGSGKGGSRAGSRRGCEEEDGGSDDESPVLSLTSSSCLASPPAPSSPSTIPSRLLYRNFDSRFLLCSASAVVFLLTSALCLSPSEPSTVSRKNLLSHLHRSSSSPRLSRNPCTSRSSRRSVLPTLCTTSETGARE